MDWAAFQRAALGDGSSAGIEFTTAGLAFQVEGGDLGVGLDGGAFSLRRNGEPVSWPARMVLADGDEVDVTPGAAGNYGYLRFDRELAINPVMGSRSTSSIAGLGGYQGRALKEGDRLDFAAPLEAVPEETGIVPARLVDGPIRVTWGLHADRFTPALRERFAEATFRISGQIDRMGARLVDGTGVFTEQAALSLVSDAIVPGDIQVLGDGTPIVLLRDHQPTGGYPRIATVIGADLDRFVQLRPGSDVRFEPVTLERAHAALRGEAR